MTELDEIFEILKKLTADVDKEHKLGSIPRVFYTNTIVRLHEIERKLKTLKHDIK